MSDQLRSERNDIGIGMEIGMEIRIEIDFVFCILIMIDSSSCQTLTWRHFGLASLFCSLFALVAPNLPTIGAARFGRL